MNPEVENFELHVCLQCEMSFRGKVCWACGRNCVRLADLSLKEREAYWLCGGYEYRAGD